MDGCPFCATYEDLPFALGGILYEDDLVCAHHYYQDGEPAYLGHLLLRTKRHVPGLAELTEDEGQAIGLAVARLSKALKTCTGAEKVYAEAYYEVVPHLHLLLTARYPGMPREFWRWKIGEWPDAPKGGAKEVIALCELLRVQLSRES
jgi:histidine triad (HIT) family protein